MSADSTENLPVRPCSTFTPHEPHYRVVWEDMGYGALCPGVVDHSARLDRAFGPEERP